jgi:hypothetical protein
MTRRGATRGNGRVINPEGDKRISPLKFVYAGQAQALRKEGLTWEFQGLMCIRRGEMQDA